MPDPYKTYRENRAKFTVKELASFRGKWVAFSSDGTRIVASAHNQFSLYQKLEKKGLTMRDFRVEYMDDPEVSLLPGITAVDDQENSS